MDTLDLPVPQRSESELPLALFAIAFFDGLIGILSLTSASSLPWTLPLGAEWSGIALMLSFFALGLGLVGAAIGLVYKRPWARPLAIVSSVIALGFIVTYVLLVGPPSRTDNPFVLFLFRPIKSLIVGLTGIFFAAQAAYLLRSSIKDAASARIQRRSSLPRCESSA